MKIVITDIFPKRQRIAYISVDELDEALEQAELHWYESGAYKDGRCRERHDEEYICWYFNCDDYIVDEGIE